MIPRWGSDAIPQQCHKSIEQLIAPQTELAGAFSQVLCQRNLNLSLPLFSVFDGTQH